MAFQVKDLMVSVSNGGAVGAKCDPTCVTSGCTRIQCSNYPTNGYQPENVASHMAGQLADLQAELLSMIG